MKEGKHSKLFLTEPALLNTPKVKLAHPSAYLDRESHFGSSANLSTAWRYIKKPASFDRVPHSHDFDEFLCFLGGNLERMFDFDATIELCMGEEQELCLIEQATIVYIPAGLVHTPLTFKRVDKPVLFQPIPLTPAYYSRFGDSVKFHTK